MAPSEESSGHRCEWRDKAEALEIRSVRLEHENSELAAKLASLSEAQSALAHEMETLTRRVLGPKSEKMPPVERELRVDAPINFEAVLKKRRDRQKQKAELETETTTFSVPTEQRRCPTCGRHDLRKLGEGKIVTRWHYIPGRFVAQREVRETLACPCGEGVVTAAGPINWKEQSRYSPSFVAHLVTSKCADSIPFYRLEKQFQRLGVPVGRSTMTDLFHTAADALEPLSERLLDVVRQAEVVHADETSLKVQAEKTCRTGFVWTFRTTWPEPLIAYRFSPSRSGETPRTILGGTTGALVVDGYTGYNAVTDVDGRARVGCHAHVRRYFFDALQTAPEARAALDFIRDLYRVEHFALESSLARSPQHLELRQTKSRAIRDRFKRWLDEQYAVAPPKSPFGTAIRYTLNRWEALGRFLDDAAIPLDNNPAEAALRRVALGRKNFLFVGNDNAGDNLAGLYSLVASCEANDVNPLEYLEDVLIRVHTHPAKRIDELLPHRWRGPPGDQPDVATAISE